MIYFLKLTHSLTHRVPVNTSADRRTITDTWRSGWPHKMTSRAKFGPRAFSLRESAVPEFECGAAQCSYITESVLVKSLDTVYSSSFIGRGRPADRALWLNTCCTFIQFHIFLSARRPVPPASATQQLHSLYNTSSNAGISFTVDFSTSTTILITFKTGEVVIHQAAAAAAAAAVELFGADCALRLHGVTVHHNGSSINWKSVSSIRGHD